MTLFIKVARCYRSAIIVNSMGLLVILLPIVICISICVDTLKKIKEFLFLPQDYILAKEKERLA